MSNKFEDLINEFTILKNASATYRAQAGDTRVKDQIVYWLNCWDDTADAAINYLKAVKAVQDEEANDKIWDLYSTGQAAFEKSKTYYVTYDRDGKENIAGRMDKISEPIGWYDYQNKIWANVVTVNGNDVTYWTYIPRYEYDVDGIYEATTLSKVRFIDTTQTTADNGFTIPESFKFNGQEIPGYWVSKYEVQFSEKSGLEQLRTKVNGGNLEIGTTNPSGLYTIYVNGVKSVEHQSLDTAYSMKAVSYTHLTLPTN
mgnify:CR=1 FL=1